jgi:hypothetical protein
MELPDVYRAIEDFDAILELAASSEGRLITGEIREELISAYDTLIQLMPQAFTLDAARDQRVDHNSPLLMQDGRSQGDGGPVYAAGLTTLEVFFLAKAEDLAATQEFRIGSVPRVSTVQDTAEISRCAGANRTAGAARDAHRRPQGQQEGYERVNGWTEKRLKKKRLRQARQIRSCRSMSLAQRVDLITKLRSSRLNVESTGSQPSSLKAVPRTSRCRHSPDEATQDLGGKTQCV